MFRSFSLLVICTLFVPCDFLHSQIVVRDSIGVDTSLTNGLGGSSTFHEGGTWNTPGMVVDVLNTGLLNQVQIVIFAGNVVGQPENTLANILGYHMRFHVWSDGILGGPDSFNDNAVGQNIPGHTRVDVNTSTASFITAEAFGETGPGKDPDLFTTFLITIDLSSFAIELQGGQQYVVGVTNDLGNHVTGGGSFRQIGSRATGFEDLFQQDDTPANQLPGFLGSQLFASYDQHAGFLSITPTFAVAADNFTVLRGNQISGGLVDTTESDDSYLKFNPGLTLNPSEPPVWIEFEGTLPTDSPTSFSVTMEASANTPNIAQTIEALNWLTGQYEQVDSQAASFNNDSVVTVDLTADIVKYVESGTGAVKTRMGWKSGGLVLQFPWTICIDQVVWTITE
jgi:hypothetical protein